MGCSTLSLFDAKKTASCAIAGGGIKCPIARSCILAYKSTAVRLFVLPVFDHKFLQHYLLDLGNVNQKVLPLSNSLETPILPP